MKKTIVVILLMIGLIAQAQTESKSEPVEWDGYTQLRFISNFNDVNSFAMRRLKLWMNSTPDFNKHWGFRLQTTITSNQNEKFFLQDVMAYYKQGQFKINMGQFVPNYSLQRFQPDYAEPLTERANVINDLIPNGTLGVRDIGVEVEYASKNNHVNSWLGLFNGYGIKEYRLNNSGFLLTHKTAFEFFDKHFYTGYSVMFRKSDKITFTGILPNSVSYSGSDFRYNLFAQWHTDNFNIQAEYLRANLDGKTADGWYILSNVNFGKNQVAASLEKYNDLISTTGDNPVCHLAYNYLLKGDKIKLMYDNSVQIAGKSLKNYYGTIQIQLFFK